MSYKVQGPSKKTKDRPLTKDTKEQPGPNMVIKIIIITTTTTTTIIIIIIVIVIIIIFILSSIGHRGPL